MSLPKWKTLRNTCSIAWTCTSLRGAPNGITLPSSCTAIEYEGDGNPDYIIASDFPLQGSSRTQTEQIVAAIRSAVTDFRAGTAPTDDQTLVVIRRIR